MQQPPRHPVPVFPLPGVVLFPHITLPLHVFELRYRTLVREALSGERLLALAVLKRGWEQDYHGSPEFHPIGCLARFEEVTWLPNDCYDLVVKGVARVRFVKVVKEFPYRAARVELDPEHPYSEDDPLVAIEKDELATVHERLLKARGAGGTVDRAAPLVRLVNSVCACSAGSPEEALELLATDSVLERGRRARELAEKRLRLGAAAKRPPDPTEPGALN